MTTSEPLIVPTDISPKVQVKDPPVKDDFAPAFEIVCLLKVVCPDAGKNGQNDHLRPEQRDHPLAGAK
jgi:hypothetical protein